MQIVIDISENVYTRLFDNGIQDNEIATDDICEMAMSLRLGTPLLKGHGDLIDRNEVIKSLFDYFNGKKTVGQCIDDVRTIIEADTESEDKV